MGKSKGAAAITNYGEVIGAKIKTCHNNVRSGGFDPWRNSDFDPWRSNDFDPCRSSGVNRSSSGVELRSGGDRLVGQQSEEGHRVEGIMKGIKGDFCDIEDLWSRHGKSRSSGTWRKSTN